jgi:hypothetical protein
MTYTYAIIVERSTAIAGAPRPQCQSCGRPGPTIDGYCVPHMPLRTEIALMTLSAEQVLAYEMRLP